MKDYYVYCHKNPITHEIFYIGKGTGSRAYITQSRGKFWKHYVNKYGIPIVEILQNNLNELEAFELEKQLIKEYGRRNTNSGCLVNSTDGGEGCSGMKHTDETKKTLSISRKGKSSNAKGSKRSKESREIQSQRMLGSKRGNYRERKDKGKTFSEDIKKNFREGKRNNSTPVLQYNKQGDLVKEWRSPADIIETLGLKGLYNNLTNISKSCGGFIWKYKIS
jgi:hypothetical protein